MSRETGSVPSMGPADHRPRFDQQCRVKAIEPVPAGSDTLLSINFLSNAVYEPRACTKQMLEPPYDKSSLGKCLARSFWLKSRKSRRVTFLACACGDA